MSSEEIHIWGLRNPVWILENGVGYTVIFSTSPGLIELWVQTSLKLHHKPVTPFLRPPTMG